MTKRVEHALKHGIPPWAFYKASGCSAGLVRNWSHRDVIAIGAKKDKASRAWVLYNSAYTYEDLVVCHLMGALTKQFSMRANEAALLCNQFVDKTSHLFNVAKRLVIDGINKDDPAWQDVNLITTWANQRISEASRSVEPNAPICLAIGVRWALTVPLLNLRDTLEEA